MQRSEFEIIQELMDELQAQMKYSEDDLGERLGRPKPQVEVMKIEAEGGDEPMLGEGDDMEEDMMVEESPEDKLKERLMKLRG